MKNHKFYQAKWYLMLIFLFSVSFPLNAQNNTEARSDYVVANSADQIRPIHVGSALPSLTVRTIDGASFDVNVAVKEKPTILIFYRGGWCVYCNRQMVQLRTLEPELIQLGYQILAISADRHEKLRESLEKHGMKYTLLSDSKMEATKKMGLAFKVDDNTLERYRKINIDLEDASGENHHILPVPAVFVTGTDGVIKYSYVSPNYKVRIDSDVLLAMAKAALKGKNDQPATMMKQ